MPTLEIQCPHIIIMYGVMRRDLFQVPSDWRLAFAAEKTATPNVMPNSTLAVLISLFSGGFHS